MNFLTAIRIILYFGLTAMLLSQPLTIVTVLLAVFTTAMVILLAFLDYKSQVYNSTPTVYRNEGMWCRMCGGSCDLENCGMEEP
jgi:uncharacterized membrane protein YjgN (DUF898 family)